MSQEIERSDRESRLARLTQHERDLYEVHVQLNRPPLSGDTQARLFALFLCGKTCAEIVAANPGHFTPADVVRARIDYQWDRLRDEHIARLLDGVRQRVQQATLEGIVVVADMLSAANKLQAQRLQRFLQSGDEKDLGDLNLSTLGQYKAVFDLMLRVSGQDAPGGKKDELPAGIVEHRHSGTVNLTPVPAADRPMTPAEAAAQVRQAKQLKKED